MAALSGMDEISNYYKRSANTIRKLIDTKNFPAVKLEGGWESDTGLIDKWRIWYILDQHNPGGRKIDLYKELLEVLTGSKVGR